MSEWKSTACILCELNCGIEVKVGENNTIEKVRGDKNHPASKGYLCNKASRLNHYQNGRDRITAPLRRKADGSFEEISWHTAIADIAEKLLEIKQKYGGDKLLYIGGGGQGNHLTGVYSSATRKALGAVYQTNAIAQEKTGEAWVFSQMFNAPMGRADFENAEVGIFLGKNPWQSHGFHQTRLILKKMQKDPNRKIVVFDPRRSETADMADYHMAVKPGTDAWALAAIIAILIQEDWVDHDWVIQHTENYQQVRNLFADISVSEYCKQCGLEESTVRELTRVIKDAGSVAFWEDLGVQMNRNSTLVSYLNKLIWTLTGNFGKKGTQYLPSFIQPLLSARYDDSRRTPVSNARIIGGYIPCNSVTDEILTDHPDRQRALWIDCSNPVHSFADTQRMQQSMRSVELSVVTDIAMTETAMQADYVLPTANQFEKPEVSFFNFDFPHNVMQVRAPIFNAPDSVLSEPEIHSRLCEAMGFIPQDVIDELNAVLDKKPEDFSKLFLAKAMGDKNLMKVAPVILYRTLGRTLDNGLEAISPLSAIALKYAMSNPQAVKDAGIEGAGLQLGENLFKALVGSRSGIEYSSEDYDASFKRIKRPGNKIELFIPELAGEVESLSKGSKTLSSDEFPFILSAGERRDYTANGIYRDNNWKKKDLSGALRMSPADAENLGVETGGAVNVISSRGTQTAVVEITERMQPGHVSLPNGGGFTNNLNTDKKLEKIGVALNMLTDSDSRDYLAGTPWHKYVPVRLETIKE